MSVAGLSGLAGCSAFSNEPSITRVHLGRIDLFNDDTEQRTIEVLVERAEDIVYWSEFTLAPSGEQRIISECENNLPWSGRGKYQVHARMESNSIWVTANAVKEARQQVEYTESERIKVNIYCEEGNLAYAIWPAQMHCS